MRSELFVMGERRLIFKKRFVFHYLCLFLAIFSCTEGGIGGSGVVIAKADTVSGVAAAGAPLAGTVILKDASSITKQLSTPPAVDGSFSFNVSGLTPPFLLQASGMAGGNNYTFYSLAATGGNCNINPLTHFAVTMANGGQDLAVIFAAPTPAKMVAIANALPAAVTSIKTELSPLFNRVGVSPVNVMTDQMAANGQGIDMLFDLVSITVSDGSVSIANKADAATILAPSSIAGGTMTASTTVVSVMPSIFTITGHAAGGNVSAQSEAPPYPSSPLMTVPTDAQGNYKFFVPNGTYEVCSYGSSSLNCLNVKVSGADVTAPDFPKVFVIPPQEQVPFQTVEKAAAPSSQVTGGIHVLRLTTEWSNFWSILKESSIPRPPLPSINFNENTAIAVVDSLRPTGGYAITITDIQKSATGVVVHAVHQSPGPDCVSAQSFTKPYNIVMTPKFSGEATLNLTETVYACH